MVNMHKVVCEMCTKYQQYYTRNISLTNSCDNRRLRTLILRESDKIYSMTRCKTLGWGVPHRCRGGVFQKVEIGGGNVSEKIF